MRATISRLALAMLLGGFSTFPAIAAEQMTMEQIVELCEKQAENQEDPDAYFEKCVDEKSTDTASAASTGNTEKAE